MRSGTLRRSSQLSDLSTEVSPIIDILAAPYQKWAQTYDAPSAAAHYSLRHSHGSGADRILAVSRPPGSFARRCAKQLPSGDKEAMMKAG